MRQLISYIPGGIILLALAYTVGHWLPPLLEFAGKHKDQIDNLNGITELSLYVVGAILLLLGIKDKFAGEKETTKTAIGPFNIGGNHSGDIIIVADPDLFLRKLSAQNHKSKPEELRRTTKEYLEYLAKRYQFLDFKGMGISHRIPFKISLLEMFVPLKARREALEEESAARSLKVGGRDFEEIRESSPWEKLEKPIPVLELLKRGF